MHFSQPPHLYQVHSLQLSFNEDSGLLLLGKPNRNLGTNYYARNQLLARNSTSNTQCTTPKVPAPHQGCSTAHRGSEGTNDSSSASSCHRCCCSSCKLSPFARSILINLLVITILLWLSPSKVCMAIHLINQVLFLTFTSNNTNWCANMMSPSDQLSSSIDSSLSHLQLQQVTTVTLFQPSWVYKWLLWTQFIQYRLCSCLNISSSTSLHLTTACYSWMFHDQMRRLCSWSSCRACQVAASRYAQAHLLCSWRS